MTFSEAMKQVRGGKVVGRRSWAMFARRQGITLVATNHLAVCGPRGWVSPEFSLFPEDMVATDWEVVNVRPPKEKMRFA